MQLSQKKKIFLNFSLNFWNLNSILNLLKKKDYPQIFCISEIAYSGNVVRQMSKKSRFRKPFDKQHDKRAQARFKSA